MGKENKIDEMEWNRGLMNIPGDLGGSKEAKELLDRYNVEGTGSMHGTKPSARNLEKHFRNEEVVERDLQEAMMNDYDTRRTIEAAALAGNEDAAKYANKGIDGVKGMVGSWELLKDLKKEHVGGGSMTGAENEAGLTHALVQHDRDVFNQSIDDRIAAAIPEEAPAEQTEDPEDHEPSRELDFAQNLADAYKQDVVNNYLEQVEPNASKSSIGSLKKSMGSYNRDLDLGEFAAGLGGGYRKDASSFAEDYKSNVKGSLKPA